MPPNTGVPTLRRASCDGPTATTSGRRPRMNAKEVIITGRKRSRAPSVAASSSGMPSLAPLLGEFHDQDAVLGRQPDQHDHADLRVEIERETGRSRSRRRSPATPTVTDSSTGTGMVQLSYSATRNR